MADLNHWLTLGRKSYQLAAAAAGLAAIEDLASEAIGSDVDGPLAQVAALAGEARRVIAMERREVAAMLATLPEPDDADDDADDLDPREAIARATDLVRAELWLAAALDLDPSGETPLARQARERVRVLGHAPVRTSPARLAN